MQRTVVVSGVSGSGKSTVGELLARRLEVPFCDGDDLHPQSNVEKMHAGIPLDDDDRRPWLLRVGAWLSEHPSGAVVACSALKRSYRDLIRAGSPRAWVVQLVGDPELIRTRQAARTGHFMPPSLLPSQFATLEPLEADEAGLTVDVAPPVEEVVRRIAAALDR
jgi:carbohydrate kinase (thermoresistant glucokinase family)